MTFTKKFSLKTKGFCDVIDITSQVAGIVAESNIKNGLVTVFVTGSTAGVTTLEANAGLEEDLKEALEIIAPQNKTYQHNQTWGDGNGFSHIRSAIIGPSLTVPLVNGGLTLGTWQQIVLCDFDNHSRNREILVQVTGD